MTNRSSFLICPFRILLFAVLLCGAILSAHAQAVRGAIAGTVRDESGAVLKGAQISIASQDINVTTDEQGHFSSAIWRPAPMTFRSAMWVWPRFITP